MPRSPGYMADYQRAWMRARRASWLAENGPCAKCGSENSLEVDHRDRNAKKLEVRALWSMAPTNPKRIAELAKCQVLCHACHAAKSTAERQPPFIHGRYPTYDTHHCRCDLCRAASRNYRYELKNRHSAVENSHAQNS